jgi:thiol:disulfide interchange protein DsbD
MLRFVRLCLAPFALIAVLGPVPARADDGFLEPDAAFKFSARMVDGHTVAVTFQIADGYYMYRERFKFSAVGAKVGALAIPAGTVHYDETFQKNVETYRKSVTMTMPVDAAGSFTLQAQGRAARTRACATRRKTTRSRWLVAARCHCLQPLLLRPPRRLPTPPRAPTACRWRRHCGGQDRRQRRRSRYACDRWRRRDDRCRCRQHGSYRAGRQTGAVTPGVTIRAIPAPVTTLLPPETSAVPAGAAGNEAGKLEAALKSGKLLVILPLFALLGLGLSFTPCVLPMVPILSSIIVGEGSNTTRGRGLLLSATYSLGMAIVYTALGVAAGLAGEGLAAALQNPWVLGSFGVLMAILSLSMFGCTTCKCRPRCNLNSALSRIASRPASWPACSSWAPFLP